MANHNFLLSCSLLLVLLNGCFGQGRIGLRKGNECQLDRINALEPTNRIEAEAGLTEIWDSNDQQFQCSGVTVLRHTIQPNGLLLPSFSSAPQLVYIERGRGITGLMIPGCPETFESLSQGSFRQGEMRGARELSHQDLHQKITHFRKGDVIAFPAGVAHWTYNDGAEPIVAVALLDNSNHANQLDQDSPRRFYLAGNPQQEHGHHQYRSGDSQRGERGQGNIFRGFDTQVLAKSFGVSEELIRRIQGEQDDRGNIVRVQEGLHVIRPPLGAGEEREFHHRGGRYTTSNGLEETICSARIRENLDDPERADIYTPHAGRLTTLNSFNLPILKFLRLSAEKGVLYRNGIMAPHYNLNSHDIVYCVRGRARIQIVNDKGNSVFDDELREGQVVVVPQNFAVVKQASDEGFEWISFKTNDNSMFQTLAGRTSAIRAMPEEVIANIYQISREQAKRLKFNRPETTLFRSQSVESQRRVATE